MGWSKRWLSSPLIAAMLVGAACGGGSSSSPVLGAAFRAKATALCRSTLTAIKAQGAFPYASFDPKNPDPSELPAVGKWELKTSSIRVAWLRKMRELREPPSGQASWSAVVAALARHVRIISEQEAAAARGDARTFAKDYFEGSQAVKDMVHAADAAGVPDCAAALEA
jgi:hypothetical protein